MKIFGRKIKVEFSSVKGMVSLMPFVGVEYDISPCISIGWMWWLVEIYFQK